MKKNLLCAAALAIGFIFNASKAEAQVSIAPRIGVNLSTINYSDGDKDFIETMNDNKTTTTGLLFGLAANAKVNDAFSIQPELLFTQKGYKLEDDGDFIEEKLHYLEIPVLAKFSFGDDELKFFVNAGPYAAYLFKGTIHANIGGLEKELEIEFDYPQQYNNPNPNTNRVRPNRLDVGLAGGGGLAIKAGSGTVNLEARYDLGLTNINEYEKERPTNVPKVSNRTLGFTVSYLIPLGN